MAQEMARELLNYAREHCRPWHWLLSYGLPIDNVFIEEPMLYSAENCSGRRLPGVITDGIVPDGWQCQGGPPVPY